MSEKLSEALVRKALPPARGQTMIWDTEVKGLALRITRAGSKAFVLDYRIEGRQRRMTIGSHPDWTVAAARETAKTMKREVDHGSDPMGERQAQREACSARSASGRCGRGWGGRPVRVEQAQGILVAALGVLEKHYGYGSMS